MTPAERARAGYRLAFGTEPQGVAFAPGRVNLIGEHVDYNDGLVLPMPIAAGTAVAWGASDDRAVEAVALDFANAADRFDLAQIEPAKVADWRAYLRGMTAAMAARGLPVAGTRLAIAGSIPRGSGLSSSASVCVAIGRALSAAARAETGVDPRELALSAQQAEHDWAGVHCGIMDQMAVAAGLPGSALLLDCRTLATQQVALPSDWAVLVVQSGVVRGLVDGHYNARRADCETAARALGLVTLRDAKSEQVEAAELDPVVRRRACHVVAEIARVEAAVVAIARADLAGFGDLLRASHASLRDLFEVSVTPVDALVDVLNQAIGAEGGARMTGGGFGGAVLGVLRQDQLARVRAELEQQYCPPDGSALAVMIEGAGGATAGTLQ